MFEQAAQIRVMHHFRGGSALVFRGDFRIRDNSRDKFFQPGFAIEFAYSRSCEYNFPTSSLCGKENRQDHFRLQGAALYAAAVAVRRKILPIFFSTQKKTSESCTRSFWNTPNSIANPWLKKLVTGIVSNPEIAAKYKRAPAAKVMHHAYLGGLLEHVIVCAASQSKLRSIIRSSILICC